MIGAGFSWCIEFGLLHPQTFALDDSILFGGLEAPNSRGKGWGGRVGRRWECHSFHFVGYCLK